MKQVDPQMRAAVVGRLRERRAEGAVSAQVRRAAAGLSVSEATVWRWLARADHPLPSRRGYSLTEADRDGYLDWRGNIAALHRERAAQGEPVPPLRTLQRAFARELTPGERGAAVDGVDGRRRHEVYLRWDPVKRNAVWEADHKELPVQVTPPRGTRPVKPWVTMFIDGFSRLIMGWALSLRPHTGVVLAALRRGFVVDPERGPFGGIPEVLRPDNGLEFVNAALERVCGVLGVHLLPTPPYLPYRKGKVERVNRTVDQTLLCGLPFYTEGPRAADGRLFGPDTPPMALALFVDRFAEWVVDYNTVRPHAHLHGQTPLQRWQDDASPIRQLPAQELRWLLLADEERTIQKDGVHFDNVIFIAPELNGRRGEAVHIRYTPHDLRQIEVFRGDAWLCTAYPQDRLSEEQRNQVLDRRRADAAELARRQRRASRRARAKLAPITAPGSIEDVTIVTAAHAVAEGMSNRDGWGVGERDAPTVGCTELLGLHNDFAYWNTEPIDLEDGAGRDGPSRDSGDQ